jgi:predicted metal-binding membrane protein
MLVAFALGMANLLWMAGLALVMTLEKRWVHGQLLARMSGVWLLVVGLTIATQALWS